MMTKTLAPRTILLLVLSLCALCARAVPWSIQVRNAAGQPLADAIVAIELNGKPLKAPPGTRAEMGQRDKQFTPQLLAVQTGTAVNFPNFDTVRHHVYSFSPTKVFETKLYSGTPAEPIVFDKPGVATLGCNIHDRMSAHIIVVDTPLFARTDAAGVARFELPPGEHQLRWWWGGMKREQFQGQVLSVGAAGPGQTAITLAD